MILRRSRFDEDSLFDFGFDGRTDPSTDLEATVSRLQRVSGELRAATMPPDLKSRIWEDTMNHSIVLGRPSSHQPSTAVDNRPRTTNSGVSAESVRRHWTSDLRTLVAAMLILAVASGMWRFAMDRSAGPGPTGPGTSSIPFGGHLAQSDGAVDPALLPTAADCTVAPLTVDDVIRYVNDPSNPSIAMSQDEQSTPLPAPLSATPADGSTTAAGHASPAMLATAASAQRMWMACVLADSYFQVWALEEPFFVRQQVIDALPALAGEDDARLILENLRDHGPSAGGANEGPFVSFVDRGYPGLGGIHMLDTAVENSWREGTPTVLTVGYIAYNIDGTVKWQPPTIFENIQGTPIATNNDGRMSIAAASCTSYMLVWNEARGMWLIARAPDCG